MSEQNDDVQAEWEAYRRTRDRDSRNRLVLRYLGLVKFLVRRIGTVSRDYTEQEDLISYGTLGLIHAIESYDPERGVAFETFAVYRIRGEMIDYIRRNDWMPRGVRQRARTLSDEMERLEAQLGRRPTEREIETALGLSERELHKRMQEMQKASVLSLEELLQAGAPAERELAGGNAPEEALQRRELLETVADAVAAMPERERLVVTLYYYEEFSIREIGDVLGVSESRVSQLHTRAVRRLRQTVSLYLNGEKIGSQPQKRAAERSVRYGSGN